MTDDRKAATRSSRLRRLVAKLRRLLAPFRSFVTDMAGAIVFYLVSFTTGSVEVGAVAGFATGACQIILYRVIGRAVPVLLALGVALSAGLGLATLAFHNARFILVKPSIIYAIVGATMLSRGWAARYMTASAVGTLPAETIDRVGWCWALLMFAMAIANVALVFLFEPQTAAALFLVLANGSKGVLLFGQYVVLKRHSPRDPEVKA